MGRPATRARPKRVVTSTSLGRGNDTVGNPHRAQISQLELFELILLLKLDKQFPVEQFEATATRSTVLFPPLNLVLFAIRVQVKGVTFLIWHTIIASDEPCRILAKSA